MTVYLSEHQVMSTPKATWHLMMFEGFGRPVAFSSHECYTNLLRTKYIVQDNLLEIWCEDTSQGILSLARFPGPLGFVAGL